MAQIFPASIDRMVRRGLLGLALVSAAVLLGALYYARSDTRWGVGVAKAQPIAFRHDLHAGTLGIDCAYCHAGATKAQSAGMPSTQTCLTCHSQIWRGTPQLAPLHAAAAKGQGIDWASVSRLPAHARFDHGAHANAAIPCATCHGPVETMEKTVKTQPLSMGWCVDCHRAPAEKGARIVRTAGAPKSHVDGRDLTDCSVCHY